MNDTIAAIATAPGEGGISIVRISGPEAERVLMALFHPAGGRKPLPTHLLSYGHVVEDGTRVDECMAVLMRAPRSYTREDVAELQLHGGGYTAQRVLALCLRAGARLAEAGEFTRRAFLNGRIDLSQAEAVMQLIAARGEQAHRAALRQLEGGASAFIRQAADELYALQGAAAACIDYPEEITEEEAAADLAPRLGALARRLDDACDERAAHLLADGLTVALCGEPNVGKSSLLNALLGEEKAIVTAIPGTTRDTVEGEITLSGNLVRLRDTAGLRETDDPVERIGVERASRTLSEADCVLLVLDGSRAMTAEERALLQSLRGRQVLVAVNKRDLPRAIDLDELRALAPEVPVLSVSAAQPDTLSPLREALAERARVSDRLTLTQPRHLAAARRAAEHLRQAAETLRTATVDLAAVDMLAAQSALAEITGDAVEEKLLDAVFSQFCVGK